MNSLRLASVALAASLVAGAVAAQPAPPPPPLPPEPAAAAPQPFTGDADLEPQVTIIRRDGETAEEVRIGGQLKFVRVTPRYGRTYYLVPDAAAGGAQFIRRDSLDTTVSVPQWVLLSW